MLSALFTVEMPVFILAVLLVCTFIISLAGNELSFERGPLLVSLTGIFCGIFNAAPVAPIFYRLSESTEMAYTGLVLGFVIGFVPALYTLLTGFRRAEDARFYAPFAQSLTLRAHSQLKGGGTLTTSWLQTGIDRFFSHARSRAELLEFIDNYLRQYGRVVETWKVTSQTANWPGGDCENVPAHHVYIITRSDLELLEKRTLTIFRHW